ncbi:MAG: polyamine aminopropyltransferase [candidate division NC10 bacterium]|nr:polyamine aminopropyltransferase [candidate division NC10 bacterium]
MAFWFTEKQTENLELNLRVRESLLVERTPFQQLAVLDTYLYGRMLVLDGAVQTTEEDEFVYHEMITHVPLITHPQPQEVLVIGGGDGGTVREIVKHPEVKRVRLVEIDERVVAAARQFLPGLSQGLDDPRAEVIITDGAEYVRAMRGACDVIIVDSTDPVGPAVKLFEADFYRAVYDALTPEGLFVAQSKSPYLDRALIRNLLDIIRSLFPVTLLYTAAIPTYPSGFWSFVLGSKMHHPLTFDERRAEKLDTRYYSPEIHRAAFILPRQIRGDLFQGE